MGRPASLSKLLSRREPDDDEFDAAMREMHEGSDRSSAILGAVFAESALATAISAALDNPDDEAALFSDQGAPFGTFKAKIVSGKALGVITAEMARDLDVIRDIRNQFAHALLAISFDNEHLDRACGRLTAYGRTNEQPDAAVSAARWLFENACWSISTALYKKSIELLREKTTVLEAGAKPDQMVTLSSLISAGFEGSREDVEDDG